MHWSQVFVCCSHLARVNAGCLASWWPAPFLVAVIAQVWRRWSGRFSDPAIWLWAKPVPTNRSKLYQSAILQLWSKVFTCPFFCQSMNFITNQKVQSKCRELTFEIVNPLPEVCHQAFCDVLEPSAIDEINLLCQWYSLARRLNGFMELRQFGLEAFLSQCHSDGYWR